MASAATSPVPETAPPADHRGRDLAATIAGHGVAPAPPTGWLESAEWSDLRMLWQGQLLPFFVEAVSDGARRLSDDERRQLEQALTDRFLETIVLERELLDLAGLLDEHEVRYRVMKGAAHAHLDYPDPALRLFGDTDLVVAAADLELAKTAIEARGYQRLKAERRAGFDTRFEKSLTLISPAGLELDLHRTFVSGPFGQCFDPDALFDAVEWFTVGSRRLPALAREERLLHACISATISDPVPRLRPARDVVQMLLHPALDGDRVVRLAHRWGLAAVLARGIVHADARLGTELDLPLVAWAATMHPSRRDRARLAPYLGSQRNYVRRTLAALRAVPGVRARAAFAAAYLFPAADAVATPIDDRSRRAARALLTGR
jgi:hypothetical protein